MPHHVSGINFLDLSVNLIPVLLSLSCLFMLLPYLVTLSTHHSHHNSLSLLFPAQDLPLSQIFPAMDSLPASGLTPRTLLGPIGRFLLSISFFVFSFYITIFCSIPCAVREIKLMAICQLLGARKLNIVHRIVSNSISLLNSDERCSAISQQLLATINSRLRVHFDGA